MTETTTRPIDGSGNARTESPAIRVLVVDDEAPARSRLHALLDRPGVIRVGEADSVASAVEAMRRHRPELVFLDIQMADGSGFDVLEAVRAKAPPVVVFVTAFDAHALRAFEVQALDYLLKPFDDRRFERTFARASESVRRRRLDGLCGQLGSLIAAAPAPVETAPNKTLPNKSLAPDTAPYPTPASAKLAVRAAGRTRLVAIDDIDWIEAAGAYVRLHTGEGSILLRQPLGQLETRLAAHRFLRIHRSTLVQADRVREIHTAAHGDGQVILEDGTTLRLSRNHRDRLERLLG